MSLSFSAAAVVVVETVWKPSVFSLSVSLPPLCLCQCFGFLSSCFGFVALQLRSIALSLSLSIYLSLALCACIRAKREEEASAAKVSDVRNICRQRLVRKLLAAWLSPLHHATQAGNKKSSSMVTELISHQEEGKTLSKSSPKSLKGAMKVIKKLKGRIGLGT